MSSTDSHTIRKYPQIRVSMDALGTLISIAEWVCPLVRVPMDVIATVPAISGPSMDGNIHTCQNIHKFHSYSDMDSTQQHSTDIQLIYTVESHYNIYVRLVRNSGWGKRSLVVAAWLPHKLYKLVLLNANTLVTKFQLKTTQF